MRLAEVIKDILRRNVPAAIVARRRGAVAIRAKQLTTVQKLFEARPLAFRQVNDVVRENDFCAATVTLSRIILGDDRSEVQVQAARHSASAFT